MKSDQFFRRYCCSKFCIRRFAILIYFYVLLWPACLADTGCFRKLNTTILCPSAEHNCTTSTGRTINLVHTAAVGPTDTIHYVYSTWGVPSVLVANTSKDAELMINYDLLLNESSNATEPSIYFSPQQPTTVLVVMIAQVIEYVDVDDKAVRGENSTSIDYDLSKSDWTEVINDTEGDQHHFIQFRTSNKTEVPHLKPGGFIGIIFRSMCNEGYYSELPNLQYNSNMSLVDVVLDNVMTSDNKSRLAIQIIVASTGGIGGNTTIQTHKSIDDEHSPGSFVTVNWLTDTNASTSGGFLQWKPTCYNQAERNLHSLSTSQYTEPLFYAFNIQNITRSLAYDYFGESLIDKTLVNIAYSNISFGLPADGFYVNTQYDAWSFSYGFGTPPTDKISITIIMIIIVGLGIPVLLTIVGAVYICVRRFRHREGYEEITGSYSEIN